MIPFLKSAWLIARKDLAIERQTRQTLNIMVVFSLVTVFVFSFTIDARLRETSSGLLWITILLAGTLGLNRAQSSEQANQGFAGLLLTPIDRSAIFVGKVISLTLITAFMELILIPVFVALFNVPFWRPQIILILFLGTIGYIAAGVLVSSMTIQTRARDVLLPILLLPLCLPSVLSASTAVSSYLATELPRWSEVQTAIALVVAYDIVMLTAGFLTYQYVVEE